MYIFGCKILGSVGPPLPPVTFIPEYPLPWEYSAFFFYHQRLFPGSHSWDEKKKDRGKEVGNQTGSSLFLIFCNFSSSPVQNQKMFKTYSELKYVELY